MRHSPTRRRKVGQGSRHALPAKLTPPRADSLFPRQRLFRQLRASEATRWTWIAAPPGAGKTSLASSWIAKTGRRCLWYRLDAGDHDPANFFHYLLQHGLRARPSARFSALTPERLPGLELYARRFFEQLFGLYVDRFIMVLDGLHEIASDSPLVAVILGALIDSLPAQGRLLCLSRQQLPPPLVPLSVESGFQELGWEDLRLTDEEALTLARVCGSVPPHLVVDCNRSVKGWAAGLQLLLRAPIDEIQRFLSGAEVTVQNLFDYFSQEVLRRVSPKQRDFLIQCAAVEDMDGPTVVALTRRRDAAAVLSKLYEDRLFIERRLSASGTTYQFHPLFRNFLRARLAESHTAADIAALKARAARSLQERGEVESATVIALECDDPDLLASLILAQAQSLVAQGRMATLELWLRAISEPDRNRNGWLLYWFGVVCSVRDAARGRVSLIGAYDRFRCANDPMGIWLAAASIIHSHLIEWGSAPAQELWYWVDVLEDIRRLNGGTIPAAIEVPIIDLLSHFAGHCPEHALSRHLVERALTLAHQTEQAEERLRIGGIVVGSLVWEGEENAASMWIERLLPEEAVQPQGVSTLALDVWRGILLWLRSEHERSYAWLSAVRARYRRAGLGCFEYMFATHLALAALSAGDWLKAGSAVEEALKTLQPPQTLLLHVCRALEAMFLSLSGRPQAGAAAARTIATLKIPLAGPLVAMERSFLASALLEAGSLNEAATCVAEALDSAARLPSDRWLFDGHMLAAGVEWERGMAQETLRHLRNALALGAKHDFRGGVGVFQAKRTAQLLELALRHDIEPQYVRGLIRHRRLRAPPDGDGRAVWPVRLRIWTLGGFTLWIDEKPLERTRQGTRKPLEVLKALIGLGPSSLATLGETLWPELDGAAAHNACHVAIHRLKKVLGDSAVRINQGVVTLDDEDAWVDLDAFRRLTSSIRAVLKAKTPAADLNRLVDKFLSAYPGHFLPTEDESWVVSVREQIRARFVNLAIELSAALERSGAQEAAVALNRHCIDLDPLTETFHRGLVKGLLQLGRKADAITAFANCEAMLKAGLRIEPSAEMYALRARIRRI